MIDYKIVIPSLSRVDQIQHLTLDYLHTAGIPKSNIYIFVIEEEYEEYKTALIDETIDKKYNYNLIIGKKGFSNQMNFIFDYFEEEDYLVRFDDDIKRLMKLDKDGKKFETLLDLEGHIEEGYNLMADNFTRLWGLQNTKNPFYLQNYKTDFRTNPPFVPGGCYGFILDKTYKSDTFVDDIELSFHIRYHYNCIIKFNKVSMDTIMRTKGGLEKERNNMNEAYWLNKLWEKYPHYIKGIEARDDEKYPFKIKFTRY